MQGNCTKPKPDELELENLHRKGAKALRTQRQAKKTKNHWIAFDFLCENFASFAPLRLCAFAVNFLLNAIVLAHCAKHMTAAPNRNTVGAALFPQKP